MDAASAIIILIFVITVFSASTGGRLAVPGLGGEGGKIPIHTNLNVEAVPDPTYAAVAGEDMQGNIERFILTYNKNTSYWDASLMSANMIKYGSIYNVNPKLICALIARESAFNPRSVSSSGALGLGQLMPTTAAALEVEDGFDPEQNIRGTSRYMRFLLDKWGSHPQQVTLALASYLEGHNAISRNGGYSVKSKGYVEDIIKIYWKI
ncbi:MAG: lytic transglycosylase domain-containing protein [bacterium]